MGCRKFLDTIGRADRTRLLHPRDLDGTPGWIFNSALGELRGVNGLHLAQLAAKHCLDVGEGLDTILPADPGNSDADDDHRGRW